MMAQRKTVRRKKTTKSVARKKPPAAPVSPAAPSAAIGAGASCWNRLIVGREHGHRLEIRLANCSITEVEARSYVLGLYCEVAPSGAAQAIDQAFGGAVTEFTQRRMFSGRVGEVFVMPANRRQMPTDSILFVGLGFFDQFDENVVQIAAENAIRTFVQTDIEDVATVLLGAGSGQPVPWLVKNLITGLIRGKRDSDRFLRFRRVTICEIDQQRYMEIRQAVFQLASTPLCEDFELSISDVQQHELRRMAPVSRVEAVPKPVAEPVYLIVRQETAKTNGPITIRASILTVGDKAGVATEACQVTQKQLTAFYHAVDRIGALGDTPAADAMLKDVGAQLQSLTLHKTIAQLLAAHQDRHLAIVHDAETSRMPWELLRFGKWVPALEEGVSRRYMADNLSIVKYLSQRLEQPMVQMLLVANPTLDLEGAKEEGERIQEIIGNRAAFKLEVLYGAEATHAALKKKFESGRYDVVHYAGHAFFDPRQRAQSGLICADEKVLSGADLANSPNLPALVVFNACESGRVRGYFARKKRKVSADDMISVAQLNIGLAEAFLRGGVANYVGTYWPVGDAAAETFASEFYVELLKGKPLGKALASARNKVLVDVESIDWADYIHYGNQNFVLRNPQDVAPLES
jgi:CHAT domain/Cytosol aminopeptidase family, N-terminal domain